jgi:hypothetical protein
VRGMVAQTTSNNYHSTTIFAVEVALDLLSIDESTHYIYIEVVFPTHEEEI